MSSAKKKMQRKKKVEDLKVKKKALKKALQTTAGMPGGCSSCDLDFDPINDADTWMIVCTAENEVQLYCPNCYNKDI